MTKTDKQFIKGLFNRLDLKIDDRFEALDHKIDKTSAGLRDELTTEIRHEGVLREQSDHNIQILAEGYQGLNERMERMEGSLVRIEENTNLIPVLWTVVARHSRRLTALEKR